MRNYVLGLLLAASLVAGEEFQIGATYVCKGERVFVENCNMRDLSDNGTCMVGHPDHVLSNGIMQYTTMTRGALKTLFSGCAPPSAKEAAAARAFQKRQQDTYNANDRKANEQLQAASQPAPTPQKPRTPEQRAMNRCITSGRLPATCMGNTLLGGFEQMFTQALPGAVPDRTPGAEMAGVFEGAGNWRLDFIDGGVLVNCAFLSPNQQYYKLGFNGNRTMITIDTTPKPLVVELRADGTISGPGPVVVDGVVATGGAYNGYRDRSGRPLSDSEVIASHGPVYDSNGQAVTNPAPRRNFARRQATCPALNLSSKGAGVGVQTMQTDLLKTMFGGEKGPPTPPGIRMRGIYAAAATGFSVQFFPESAVLGCGPDAARAYPYSVQAGASRLTVTVAAADRPLTLTMRPDGSLDPGSSGAYQVHGRIVTGQNDNDDFTFAPLEQSCSLAPLVASKAIPLGGGVSGVGGGGSLASPAAPLGNAVLTITSGFAAQAGGANPLAGRPYVLLRDSYNETLAKGGVAVPAGMSGYKFVAQVCGGTRTPDCQRAVDAIKANAASSVRADANGNGTFPGVAPGRYYLMISTRYNNQGLAWGQAVDLKPGANSFVLDAGNATPLN